MVILPLFSIYEISRLPLGIKKSVDKILEVSQGFYFLKYNEGKVLIVLQNPIIRANTYQRHGLQFIEILNDGTIRDYVAGYSGIEGEMEESNSTSDLWDYDDSIDIKRPLKHISFDEKGKVSFVETWNYDEQEPIKYQMRDASKKVLSVLKETKDNDLNLRREHIFYDNAGNIKMSVSVNYDGANISRFNFYNSHDSIDGVSVISEYSEGMKIKEYIYDEDYSLNYTVVADYLNDDRKSITIFDSEGNVINKITS